MALWTRWRADLVRPETPTDRTEVVFLAIGSALIVGVAYATDPGSAAEVALVAAAGVALVAGAAVGRLPWDVVAVLVNVPLAIGVGGAGDLEVAFFLAVLVTLYAAGIWPR